MAFLTAIGATVVIIFSVLFYVLLVVADWKIFMKAGEPGWKSIIPFYNEYITFKISWKTSMFWITMALSLVAGICSSIEGSATQAIAGIAALAAIVILIIDMYKLAKAFGHGIGYTIGMIFLPNVFTLILGFGNDRYLGPQ